MFLGTGRVFASRTPASNVDDSVTGGCVVCGLIQRAMRWVPGSSSVPEPPPCTHEPDFLPPMGNVSRLPVGETGGGYPPSCPCHPRKPVLSRLPFSG